MMFDDLAAPFPPEAVSWRVGTSNKKKRQRETGDNNAKANKGQVLAYLDARDVMDRLDKVCGPGGWQNRYTHADKKTICEIGILFDGQWVWKADGAGDSDIEAEKGALSDAFKRCAVRWGIGRYLYHLPTPWVELDEWEKIPQTEMQKLYRLLSNAGAPAKESSARQDFKKPEISGACLMACDLMKACKSGEEFKEFWKLNKDGLKRELAPHEYAEAVRVMQEEGARWKAKAEKEKPVATTLTDDDIPAAFR